MEYSNANDLKRIELLENISKSAYNVIGDAVACYGDTISSSLDHYTKACDELENFNKALQEIEDQKQMQLF